MGKKRKFSRSSLGGVSCFGSGDVSSYERLGDEQLQQHDLPKFIKIQGGENCRGRTRCPSVSKFTLLVAKKLKGACSRVMDAANNAYLGDLFSSNQFLMQLSVAPMDKLNKKKKQQLRPTVGFINS